jgi:2-amino-4-hydroxy-6-hydroxymethyldihydropteridine diphosphokinase
MPRAFLSIGSNLGGRMDNCIIALAKLDHSRDLDVLNVSEPYETEPWGKTDQPDYINSVVEIETQLTPHELLATCKQIEEAMGREPGERWGPRIIDLDILLYEDLVIEDQDLVLPHPHMHERRFVLAPLAEIAPGVRHPILKRTSAELLEDLGSGGGKVKPLDRDVPRS